MRLGWGVLAAALLGVFLSVSVQAAVLECGSCGTCNAQIAAAADGDIVQLNTPIQAVSGTCISFGGKDNLTFDCLGNAIDGDDTDMDYGIWLNESGGGSNGNTIRNCAVTDFWMGVFLKSSSNNLLTNVRVDSNDNGIVQAGGSNNRYAGIAANSNKYSGLDTTVASNSIITDAIFYSNYYGVALQFGSNYNVLTNVTASSNYQGIYMRAITGYPDTMYNLINNSRMENNTYGVYFASGPGESYVRYNTFYNNYLNNSVNFYSGNGSNVNYWNSSRDCTKTNIMGFQCMGGNYWTGPGGNFSDTCTDSDQDMICDSAYALDPGNADYLPLTRDRIPPDITFVPPTPANGTNASGNFMEVNASLSEAPGICILGWHNGTWANYTMSIQGLSCRRNMTALLNQVYLFRVYANDSAGNWNSSQTMQAGINNPLQQASLLVLHSISPKSVRLSQSTALSVNATSNGTMDRIILTITLPNSTAAVFSLPGNTTMNYTPPTAGLYNVTVFANNTLGYNYTISDNFTAANPITFNSTTSTYNSTAIPLKLELYYPGTDYLLYGFNSPSGSIASQEILDQSYDMLFKSHNDKLQVRLRNVNISQNLERAMGFDNPQAAGYLTAYAVQNSYTLSSASVRIYYSDLNEDYIGLYKCDSWNFTARLCSGTWSSINYSQDDDNNYIAFDVSSFSGFSLKQEPFCGDGICQPDSENSNNCAQDCVCAEGEKMSCGVNKGECRAGNLTCHGGAWGNVCEGQVEPQNETCDGKDNDCDGQIDEGLTQACGNNTGACRSGTRTCASGVWGTCTGSTVAVPEACNGLDDDCDGVVDNNADCCAEGSTREFGTSLTRGICHPGTCMCAGGTWNNCTEAVTAQKEVCNDGLDNDCDGLTDSQDLLDCAGSTCANGVQDGNETGTDCGGECTPCQDYTMIWICLSATGAIVLGILLFLYFKLRKQGKELTWEELAKKWTPSAQ
jgi:hypothetical protein